MDARDRYDHYAKAVGALADAIKELSNIGTADLAAVDSRAADAHAEHVAGAQFRGSSRGRPRADRPIRQSLFPTERGENYDAIQRRGSVSNESVPSLARTIVASIATMLDEVTDAASAGIKS